MKTSAAVCGVIALIFGIITSRASRTYLVYSYLAKKLTSSLALFSLAYYSVSSKITRVDSPVAIAFSRFLFLNLRDLMA
jgi:hypothetical protein